MSSNKFQPIRHGESIPNIYVQTVGQQPNSTSNIHQQAHSSPAVRSYEHSHRRDRENSPTKPFGYTSNTTSHNSPRNRIKSSNQSQMLSNPTSSSHHTSSHHHSHQDSFDKQNMHHKPSHDNNNNTRIRTKQRSNGSLRSDVNTYRERHGSRGNSPIRRKLISSTSTTQLLNENSGKK